MHLDALPREAWIVLGVAVVLIGAAVLYAIADGRVINLVFKKGTSQLDVGVGKKPGRRDTPLPSGAIRDTEVLRNSKVSNSDVRVHIGNVTGDKHD